MATTVNNVKVDFGYGAQAPRVTFLQGCDMDIATIRGNLRAIEESEEGRASAFGVTKQGDGRGWICRSGGNFEYSESESSALVLEILAPFTIFFEAGAIPFQTSTGSILGTFEDSPGAIVQINNAIGASNINNASIEFGAFAGFVWVDTVNGTSGTGYATAGRPLGTQQDPVDNVNDAVTIANSRGIDALYFSTSYTFDGTEDISDLKLVGRDSSNVTLTFHTDTVSAEIQVESVTATGTLKEALSFGFCYISALELTTGEAHDVDWRECRFGAGGLTIPSAQTGDYGFYNCKSDVAGASTPFIDVNSAPCDLLVRDWTGGIEWRNINQGQEVSFDFNSGHCNLASSCTSGNILVRGIGKLTDDSAGATITNELLTAKKLLEFPTWVGLK